MDSNSRFGAKKPTVSYPYRSLTPRHGDEFRAAVRAYDAGLTEDLYNGCLSFIEHLFGLPSSKAALTVLARALLEKEGLLTFGGEPERKAAVSKLGSG
jgi:hypothetical protein